MARRARHDTPTPLRRVNIKVTPMLARVVEQALAKEPGARQESLRDLARDRGIRVQHIHGRVKHPQTGGKCERVIGTIKASLRRRWPDGRSVFRDVDDVVRWYNERKRHMSLDFEHAETPPEAFERKLRPKEREVWRGRQ